MTPRRVGKANLGRRRSFRPERARILVVTEGMTTEPEYFNGLAQHLRSTGVRLKGPTVKRRGRDPLGVVRLAESVYSKDNDFDYVWCVFDVDSHSRLDPAVREAARLNFHIAVSNPCVELWLLWHFEDQSAEISGPDLRRRLRRYGFRDKSLPTSFPYGAYRDARDRCVKPCDAVPENPGSGLCALVSLMSGEGAPR